MVWVVGFCMFGIRNTPLTPCVFAAWASAAGSMAPKPPSARINAGKGTGFRPMLAKELKIDGR